MIESKFQRCEPNHPNRCQSVGKGGQCPFLALPGVQYCTRHNGHAGLRKVAKENAKLYLLSRYQDRLDKQAEHPRLKSLREEVGVLRMTLELLINSVKSDEELLMRSATITEMVREIGKLVKAATNLDMLMSAVMDKSQATEFIKDLSTILTQYIDDPDYLEAIAEDMMEALEKRTNLG